MLPLNALEGRGGEGRGEEGRGGGVSTPSEVKRYS